jgi:hypothetical protein
MRPDRQPRGGYGKKASKAARLAWLPTLARWRGMPLGYTVAHSGLGLPGPMGPLAPRHYPAAREDGPAVVFAGATHSAGASLTVYRPCALFVSSASGRLWVYSVARKASPVRKWLHLEAGGYKLYPMNNTQTWAIESADGTAMGEGMTEEQARAGVARNRTRGIESYAVDYASDESEGE